MIQTKMNNKCSQVGNETGKQLPNHLTIKKNRYQTVEGWYGVAGKGRSKSSLNLIHPLTV